MELNIFRAISGLLFLFISTSVWADVILTPADCVADSCWTSISNKNPNANAIEELVGTQNELFKLYQSEGKADDEGEFASFYDTEFDNTPGDPKDALIEWLGGSSIECFECYLSIKGGSNKDKTDISLYVFDISFWDGEMSIDLNDFWPDNGAISNVVIWVPTPPTLGLLGFVLIGLSIISRRRLDGPS